MNFQGLQFIEDANTYLDTAIKRAKKKSSELKSSLRLKDKVAKSKRVEQKKIVTIQGSLDKALSLIEESYPSFDSLPEFYKELTMLHFDIDEIRKSLGTIKWGRQKIREFTSDCERRIKSSRTISETEQHRRAYYGRISSIMKQLNKHFSFLERVRKTMKIFPAIKEKNFTICIVGFPNVGKSTLLSKLTDAKVEINSYAFTTRQLLVGYKTYRHHKLQFIDTPGTLARDDKKNIIEKQAELAIKYLADTLVYVFDPSENYPLEKQEKLLKNVKKYNKPLLLYLSKTDIADPDIIDEITQKHPNIMTDKILLLQKLGEEYDKY